MKQRIVAVCALMFVACCGVAHAQVFVKPSGHKATPVRVRALSADVDIWGALAITNWTMKVQMENLGDGGDYYGNEGGVSDWVMAARCQGDGVWDQCRAGRVGWARGAKLGRGAARDFSRGAR